MSTEKDFWGNLVKKAGFTRVRKTPAILPEAYFNNYGPSRELIPPYNLFNLYEKVEKSWPMGQILRSLQQETTRGGWHLEPNFRYRCKKCGREYTEREDECEICGRKTMVEPEYFQRVRAEKLLEKPNTEDDLFKEIVNSVLYHGLVADKWYISLEYADGGSLGLVPVGIKVLDTRYINPVVDKYGRLGGGNEYFCPIHWETYNDQSNGKVYPRPGSCPVCGLNLQEIAYIQKVSGHVTAVWSKRQMVKGSFSRILPRIHGNPRGKQLWDIINTMIVMDQWYYDTFKEGRLEKIVIFKGYNQAKVTDLVLKVKESQDKIQEYDSFTDKWRTEKKQKILMLGGEAGIDVADVGLDPGKIGLLDAYKLYVQACAGLYGVQAIFVGTIEGGRAGTTPAMQIEVNNRAIEELQTMIEDVFNLLLFPKFGITEWSFKFKPLEKKDAKRDMEVEKLRAEAASVWIQAGFEVKRDGDGELIISDKPKHDILKMQADAAKAALAAKKQIGDSPRGTKESNASRRTINETTTERKPHGTRPANATDAARNAKK